MYNLFAKKGQTIAAVISLIGVLVFFVPVINGLKADNLLGGDVAQALKGDSKLTFDYFMPSLYFVVMLIIAAMAIWIIFEVIHTMSDLKGSLKSIIGMVALIVLFIVLSATSETDFTGAISDTIQKFSITESLSKNISGGIKLNLLLIVGAVAGALGLEVYNTIR